jgi:hypothetical protein
LGKPSLKNQRKEEKRKLSGCNWQKSSHFQPQQKASWFEGKKGNLRSSWKLGSIFCIILLALSALPQGMSSIAKFLP